MKTGKISLKSFLLLLCKKKCMLTVDFYIHCLLAILDVINMQNDTGVQSSSPVQIYITQLTL